ncbi:hypothetical protein I215_02408 [Galbibacter marinus]|uniref:DUF1343 domain-containing protein n=1 Tax=Galbibacter marinus TaxID=555500 RepID=K2P5U1_9FLAO|nr:DUF1343 domain-containing protein [Galbibacter marinus]EKF56338.1 hypothetical protein I215_02408 [Galbibacter marinus]
MRNFKIFKSTLLLSFLLIISCANGSQKQKTKAVEKDNRTTPKQIIVGANQTAQYRSLIGNKKVGVVANNTSVIFKNDETYTHLVDSLLAMDVKVQKIYSPEHGFRGEADAGEHVVGNKDTKTGLPIVSLYGDSRKPSAEQLEGIELMIFDIQDVGVRFYTYTSTLHLVMEACAEKNIPVIVLDRPNPNGSFVDGPILELENSSFLGLVPIPLVYGLTIGEYATMLNGEKWLKEGVQCDLTVIPLKNYTHHSSYSLPIRPSPNLPNDQSVELYPSLGLFEGTHVNAGRGTEYQFQRFGAPFLDKQFFTFTYTPKPNFGSKDPKHNGDLCFGKDLSQITPPKKVDLSWIIEAYEHSTDKSKFFRTSSFTKHAGTAQLQKQIENGLSAGEISMSWKQDLDHFKEIRKKYLIYKE